MCLHCVNLKEPAAFWAESRLFGVFCHSGARVSILAPLLHFVATQIVHQAATGLTYMGGRDSIQPQH
jgi:hypothetical protein